MAAFSDEMLMAYADGELDPAAERDVAEALRSNPDLNRRYLAFARTGRDLGQPFADLLNEPPPASLVAMINSHMRRTGPAPGRARRVPRRQSWSEWLSDHLLPMGGPAWGAAGYGLALVAGIGAGAIMSGGEYPGGQALVANGGLAAPGALATALETGRSGAVQAVAGSGETVTARLTFKTASGDFCRQYAMALPGGASEEGVACRVGGQWTIRAHGPGSAPSASGVTVPAAGGGSALVEAVVDGLIAGNVLTVDEEDRALFDRWQK